MSFRCQEIATASLKKIKNILYKMLDFEIEFSCFLATLRDGSATHFLVAILRLKTYDAGEMVQHYTTDFFVEKFPN